MYSLCQVVMVKEVNDVQAESCTVLHNEIRSSESSLRLASFHQAGTVGWSKTMID